jgi:predicted lipid-binding transport protein (Tim44 family)
MKRFPLFALILTLGLAFSIPDAEARRFGGGSSFGMKRNSSLMQRNATPAPAQPARQAGQQAAQAKPGTPATTPPAASGMRRWLGPIAGLAAGLGLAALFSHLGMGAEMGSLLLMLLIAGGVIFLLRRLASGNRPAPQLQPAADLRGAAQSRFEPLTTPAGSAAHVTPPTANSIPADFDSTGFLRQAKLNFIRLQAANDAGNLEDIRAVTTPEVFAEIRLQHQERSAAAQHTDVVQLDAELLEVSAEAGQQIASVQFFGQIREQADAAPASFDEVWHLARPLDGSGGWLIAGIQQVNG